eukprot:GHVL01015997.1.p1 GENE.GHVL01015997.1~~GHVL01015997.1.p1  ORF type:complete len:126 (+),score=26.69 GHVL01015997.1:393-770(+)
MDCWKLLKKSINDKDVGYLIWIQFQKFLQMKPSLSVSLTNDLIGLKISTKFYRRLEDADFKMAEISVSGFGVLDLFIVSLDELIHCEIKKNHDEIKILTAKMYCVSPLTEEISKVFVKRVLTLIE